VLRQSLKQSGLTYRCYRQDDDVVVVDPGSRRVINVLE